MGSGSEPTENSDYVELPPDFVYPSNPYSGDTWLSAFAGQRGDGFDQGVNFAAGFADNLTFNATWAWRDRVWGTDTVDYGTAYSAGGWAATAVQLPGGIAAVKTAAKSALSAANSFDDLGRCGNIVTKLVHGGCFVPGTLVTLSELPRDASFEVALWGEEDFSELHQADWLAVSGMVQAAGSSATAIATQPVRSIQVPIEQVPLGARVPTKNPKPWEYDDSLPEPDEATWAVVCLTVERADGGVVDAELLRPREWIERYGIEAGQLLPLNIEELQIQGLARVNSVTAAPRIASGEGSAVTGRFITRQVDIITRIEVLAADGQVETIEGTTIHPVWSVDRDDWVPLGELEQGEQLLGAAGPAVVLTHAILQRSTPVYNIEVHGEHVYEIGYCRVLVHNSAGCVGTYKELRSLIKGSRLEAHHLIEKRFAGVLGQKASEMMSIVVNPNQHITFTKAWRASFPYGTDYGKLSPAQVEAAARQIYAKFPIILDALGL